MDIHQSMDTPSPSDIIAQTLLGLREESDLESERRDCSLAKGEKECEGTPPPPHFFRGVQKERLRISP